MVFPLLQFRTSLHRILGSAQSQQQQIPSSQPSVVIVFWRRDNKQTERKPSCSLEYIQIFSVHNSIYTIYQIYNIKLLVLRIENLYYNTKTTLWFPCHREKIAEWKMYGKYNASMCLFWSSCSSQYSHYPLHWIMNLFPKSTFPNDFPPRPSRRVQTRTMTTKQFLSTYKECPQSKEGCHLSKHDTLGIVFSYERMLMACWRLPAVPPQGKVVFKEEWLCPSHIIKM